MSVANCRELLQAVDWAKTSLGAIESWPRSLRSYVAMILEMPTPAIIFWGPEQVQIYNDGYATIMGPRHPRYLGATYRECWPDTYPVIHPWMIGVLERGEVKQVENTLFTLTRHGFTEEAYFTFTFSPLRDDDDRIAGIFQPVVETTGFVLAERRAATLRDLAARSEHGVWGLSALAANPKDIPFALLYAEDAGGGLTLSGCVGVERRSEYPAVADVARRVFDSGADEQLAGIDSLLGAPHLSCWSDPTRSAVALPVRVGANERPLAVLVLGITPRLRYDEAYRSFFHSVAQQIAESLAAVRSLAAQAERRKQVESLRLAAEAASQAKDEFLAILGHELRNPLAPILTAVHLLRMRSGKTFEREVDVIDRQASHLVRLVDDLLDVSRITRGKIELRKERVSIARVVDRAIEMVTPILEERHHVLDVQVPGPGLVVDVDPSRLAQVLANLLSNAAKYTEKGGKITLYARRTGDEISIGVTDTGMGIEPEMLSRVFDLFTQAPQALDRARGGLGLGLAIVRRLMELHDGRVVARSEGRGRGSEFEITLPAAPTSWLPEATTQSAPVLDAGGHFRILIVDDNENAADLLAESLAALGHATRVAYNGPSAIDLVEGFDPQVALLDIGLPVMDGYELAQRLRERHNPQMRLVAITGYGQASDSDRARRAGFDAHLAKPVSFDRLAATLRALIR